MFKKKLTAFCLSLSLCMVIIPSISVTNVMAGKNSESRGLIGGVVDGVQNFIGGVKDIWNFFVDFTVPNDEMNILNDIMDQEYKIDIKYHKKRSEEGVKEERDYKRWFDLELYKNVHNLIGGAGGTISGTELMVPSSVPQSGILADCTNINYVGGKGYGQGWVSPCREMYDLWASKGKTSDRGIATIDGYYLVAVRPQFGNVGDIIGVRLEDGTEINCMIFDTKGEDADSWGHLYGNGYSLIEWEFNGPDTHVGTPNPDLTDWKGKKVTSIVNGGPYADGVTGSGGAGSTDTHKAQDGDPYFEFKSNGDYSNISEVSQIYMETKWAAIENLIGSIQVDSSAEAILSDEIEEYEDELEDAAEEHGFTVYKELFKAVAECRHKKNDDDIFRIKDTSLNPYPGEEVSRKDSIRIAATLFAKCLETANYPDFTSAESLKALLQAFEFESTQYILEYNNKYSIKTAEKYASKKCKGRKRTNQELIETYGLYDFKDQKFPEKVLKYYTVVSVNTADMTAEEQALLSEAMASWPSNLDPRRKTVIEKALSLYGKVSYSMGLRYNNPNPDAPIYLDCSGYVGWAFEKSRVGGADTTYTTVTFLDTWKNIGKNEMLPGDVGLMSDTREAGGANHIGIYIGKSSSGSDVWLHCTGFRGSANGYPGPYVQGDSWVTNNYHCINRGIMITDQTGRSEGYVGTWTVFMRCPNL